ncbi:MAG: response regulator transcription factor [Chloroflexota bacterium]|nr:response regulator transcription factor [Chloroflexota bacterium]
MPEAESNESLTILVVDDEPAMVGVLGALLGRAGHRIVAAYDGDEALRRFEADSPDLVLLDLSMPAKDGAEVCRAIRARSATPIIVVTGERDAASLVELLDLGADDYVSKPFRSDELLARIRAVSRRVSPGPVAAGVPAGESDWQLDLRRHEIRWRGQVLEATIIEFRLLRRLVERLGEVVTHDDLLAAGWPGVADPDPLWLKPHLARLREKLDRIGAAKPAAVRAVGYRLDPTGATSDPTKAPA